MHVELVISINMHTTTCGREWVEAELDKEDEVAI